MEDRARRFGNAGTQTIVRYDRADTFDRISPPGGRVPIPDLVWLAQRGNPMAIRVCASITAHLTSKVMTERWPGQNLRELRADLAVRVVRDVRVRLLHSADRRHWQWN
jgi:hypothetical protein